MDFTASSHKSSAAHFALSSCNEPTSNSRRFSDKWRSGSGLIVELKIPSRMPTIADLLRSVDQLCVENMDPRVANWSLMGSPWRMLSILAAYVLFVKVFGPMHMRDRKPYNVKSLLMAYNMFMVVSNGWYVFAVGSDSYFGGGYSFFCQASNTGTEAQQMRLTKAGHYFLYLKIIELMDTVFFVLTKKTSNISHLHVIHHTLVAWTLWTVVNFGGSTGQNIFFCLINCFIHVIMYSYYALAALGLHKYLWWKRYLTQMQMVQFVCLIVHSSIPVFYDCGFPPFFGYVTIFEASLFLVLFYNFYSKTYKKEEITSAKTNKAS